MKKIALLLCIIMCVSVIVSCKASEGNNSDTTAETYDMGCNVTGRTPDYWVDEGAFTILVSSKKDNVNFDYNLYYYYDYYTVTTLEECDAFYELSSEERMIDGKHRFVYQGYGILTYYNNVGLSIVISDNFIEDVRANSLAGECKYDLLIGTAEEFIKLANEGYLADLYSVEDGSSKDLFDCEPPENDDSDFWTVFDKNISKQTEINGKLYYTKNHYTLDDIAYVVYFDPLLFKEQNITTPSEYVEKNQWTLDTWSKLIRSFNGDVNGPGSKYKYSGTLYKYEETKAFLIGAGLSASEYDGKKYTQGNAWTTDLQKTKTVLQKCKEVFSSAQSICISDDTNTYEGFFSKLNYYLNYHLFCRTHNKPGGVLMFSDYFSRHFFECRDYGYVPMPKYDEKQEKYYSLLPENSLFIAIPSYAEDLYRSVCVAGQLNLPQIKESVPFLQIYDNRVIDFGILNDFGGMRSKILDVDIRTNDIIQNYKDNEKAILDSMKE